jgi:hypothetical protein
MTMRTLLAAGVVALLATAAAFGQSAAPTPGTTGESPYPVVLSPETQALVREQAKRPNLPLATLREPARIDMIIPEEVELLTMPQDIASDTPTTTSYRYLITSDVIAVVEPQSRKVIQLITR